MSGYRETNGVRLLQREPASLVVPLVIGFGGAFSLGVGGGPADDHVSFVGGLVAGPVAIGSGGDACCLQVNFTPLGARRFLRVAMRDIEASIVAPELLLGRPFLALRGRLAECAGWDERFALVEAFVQARLSDAPAADPAVGFAYRRIVESGGRVRVSRLAAETGWSRKHLAARFADQVGLTPKAVARIVRFERAAGLARTGAAGGWADIAAECGFTDQPHLVDEFRALAGLTPTEWIALAA
ncbi:MAG: helix-turn-helix transcriptional regulator [Rhizobiaceae bacterium]|nr:helix-turn-helix transcriptional regulator [Rhizobiaceae bacterium]